MLTVTENEETRLFCQIFIMCGILIGGLPPSPPGYANDCNYNAICDIEILCGFLLVCPYVHIKAILMVLFCMIMLNM